MRDAVGARYSGVLNEAMELDACDMSKAMIKAMQVMWHVDLETLRIATQKQQHKEWSSKTHYQESNEPNKLAQRKHVGIHEVHWGNKWMGSLA